MKRNCKGCRFLEGEHIALLGMVRWFCLAIPTPYPNGKTRVGSWYRGYRVKEDPDGIWAETPDCHQNCPGWQPENDEATFYQTSLNLH